MRAIDFPEANKVFEKPEGMTDEQCHPLSVYQGVGPDGMPYINSCWQPNKEDIEAILAGRPIVLSIVGNGMPPVSLFTFDENGNLNE